MEPLLISSPKPGRRKNGGGFWVQTLINAAGGDPLSKMIQMQAPSLRKINWLSPLREEGYSVYNTASLIERIRSEDLSLTHDRFKPLLRRENISWSGECLDFWPDHGPTWDAVGLAWDGTLLLVYAMAHGDRDSRCKASKPKSHQQISQVFRELHDQLAPWQPYSKEAWMNTYYQFASRLAFMAALRKNGIPAKLLLLQISNDPTHHWTPPVKWEQYNRTMLSRMFGLDLPGGYPVQPCKGVPIYHNDNNGRPVRLCLVPLWRHILFIPFDAG